MLLKIKEVTSKQDLKQFIRFPFGLYKGNTSYVPPLIEFELSTLSREKNPAFESADAKYWMVKKDNKIVGRIAAIVLDRELENKQLGRFGWVDFIDDYEVSTLLFETAKEWVVSKGAKAIHGPLGFTDLDFQGALTDGYDELATQATIYNHPYYSGHYKKWGMEIIATWVEMRGSVPNKVPAKITRVANIANSRFNLKSKRFKRGKEILKYSTEIFELINETFSELYGYQPLTQKQIDYYVDQYFTFMQIKYICVVVNEDDEVVGFGICLPSISKALQKAKGRLFPFGFIHILKAFYFSDHIDLLLIGIKKEYQRKGAPAIIIDTLGKIFIDNEIEHLTNGPALEENQGVLKLWREFDLEPKLRRSCFIKKF